MCRWGCARRRARIAEYFDDHYFAHGHTYEAHPMTLGARHSDHSRWMQRFNLVERSRAWVTYSGEKLKALATWTTFLRREVRGSDSFRPWICERTARPRSL